MNNASVHIICVHYIFVNKISFGIYNVKMCAWLHKIYMFEDIRSRTERVFVQVGLYIFVLFRLVFYVVLCDRLN